MLSFFHNFPRPDPETGAFHFEQGSNWILEHNTLFFVCAVGYLPLLWVLGKIMERREKGFNLRVPLVLWNSSLAVFSIAGAYNVVRLLLWRTLEGQPIVNTLCDPTIWSRPSSYWLFLIVASKLFELVDTVFLRLRKRPVIFLHWYHHLVTLLWCWYSSRHAWRISSSIFHVGSAMNYLVHSIMYTYYALAAMGYGRTMAKMRINVLLTSSQILQMAVGLYAAIVSAKCPGNVDDFGFYTGVAMYASYFVLFAKLFVEKYVGGGAAPPPKKRL